ncbi:hypothetical protein KY347_03215 [Candidatus Woesearchaeota archaeon]|nr:hypothetical protein [Candidatus Woesearchaeota archaeon]
MNLEKPYLLVVFGLLLFIGISNLWDHTLEHGFPYGYLASDTFQQQTRAEGINDAGNYRFEPFYIVKGYEDVIGYYPPVIHHLGVILHSSTGIPVYDTVYFMVFFNAILAAFVMYLIIRSYNKQIAILSLPLSILIFSSKPYIGFLWGHWASITGQLMLICIFWAVIKIDMNKAEILLGIFFGALALAHTSELIYGAGFVFIYAVLLLFLKKFNLKFTKKILVAAVISGVISLYNLFIFVNGFMVINPYQFEVSRDWGSTPIFYLTDFGLLLIFLSIGLIVSFTLIKKISIPILAGLFMLLVGYTNYIGFGIRAFQPRFFWPIYLSFFFGLGLYSLIKFVPSKFRIISTFGVSILSILVLSKVFAIPGMPAYSKISNPGLMDLPHWEAFQWLSQNTPIDSKLYFFYGDSYGQDAILRNSKRVHALVTSEGFIEVLQNKTINRVYPSKAPADHAAGWPYFKSFLNIGLHSEEADMNSWRSQPNIDICLFDYHIFDKVSMQPVLAQYNLLIASEMIKKGAKKVFENDAVVVLKNENVNGDCIEQTNF